MMFRYSIENRLCGNIISSFSEFWVMKIIFFYKCLATEELEGILAHCTLLTAVWNIVYCIFIEKIYFWYYFVDIWHSRYDNFNI